MSSGISAQPSHSSPDRRSLVLRASIAFLFLFSLSFLFTSFFLLYLSDSHSSVARQAFAVPLRRGSRHSGTLNAINTFASRVDSSGPCFPCRKRILSMLTQGIHHKMVDLRTFSDFLCTLELKHEFRPRCGHNPSSSSLC